MSRLARARGVWEEILLAEPCLRSQVKEEGEKKLCLNHMCEGKQPCVAICCFVFRRRDNICPD